MKCLRLNPTEFAVLEYIYHKGDQPIQKIGEKVLIARSITYVVDKLEEKGFLERRPCSKGRRMIYAGITEQGKKFMDEVFPKHKKSDASTMCRFDGEGKRQSLSC